MAEGGVSLINHSLGETSQDCSGRPRREIDEVYASGESRRDFLDHDCAHEAVAARALSVFFPTQVVAPVQRHVSAKRLLCSLDETYYAGLSDASKRSFAVQGGELSRSEAMRLLALEGMDDAMALRRWDDRAKVHGVAVPDLDAYRQVVLDHLL